MRILQVCPHYVPAYRYGGVLRVVHGLSKALVAQGNQVHVCTTNLRDPHGNLDVPSDWPVELDGVRVFYEPVIVSRYWGFSPRMVRRLVKETAWADVVLIHFHYQFASLIGGWISRLQRKPYVMFTHGSLNHRALAARSRVRKKLYLRGVESGNFQRALFVAYQSEEEMAASLQLGQGYVVHNGLDLDAFQTLPERGYFRQKYPELVGKVVFLYLSRFDENKGLDLLLPVFQQLVGQRENVHLVMAGPDERGYEAQVREMIAAFGLSNKVTLTGLISGADKLGALQDADIYVLPSRYEGLSISMLEAMYMGLPVVISDQVGLWHQVRELECGLVHELSVDSLGAALLAMVDNENRAEMGQRGRRLIVECHTWSAIAQDLMLQLECELNATSTNCLSEPVPGPDLLSTGR